MQWPLTIADKPFPWTVASERAAMLVAEDEMTYRQIYDELGFNHTTNHISVWLRHPEFAARVKEHRADFLEVHQRYSVAKVNARFAALEKRWLAMKDIIEARKKDPLMKFVPGGETGLIRIVKIKWVLLKDEKGAETLEGRPQEWAFDAKLCQEMRACEQHAAQMMGEWVKKVEITDTTEKKEEARNVLEVMARMFAMADQRRTEALQPTIVASNDPEPVSPPRP